MNGLLNTRVAITASALMLASLVGCNGTTTENKPINGTASEKKVPVDVKNDNITSLPGLTINQSAKTVDMDAEIAINEGVLELVACADKTKEHESIVALDASPQQVHFALLLLGLEAGSPGMYTEEGQKAATGAKLKVFLVIDGVEKPISDYIIGVDGNTAMTGNDFVFSGSRFSRTDTGVITYEANNSGNIVSLVSFGDDVIALPTPASQLNKDLLWEVKKGALPKPGTKVTLRLKSTG